MAIQIQGSEVQSVANGTSLAYSKPATLANGDVLIHTLWRTDNQAVTNPTGFTVGVSRSTSEGDDGYTQISYKAITDAASEPSTYTWSWTGGETGGGVLHHIRGVDTSDLPHVTASGSDASSEDDIDMVAITTTVDNCLLMFCGACWGFGLPGMTQGTFTAPTNWNKRWEYGNNTNNDIDGVDGRRTLASAGTSPAATWSWTGANADFDMHCILALAPAPEGNLAKRIMTCF